MRAVSSHKVRADFTPMQKTRTPRASGSKLHNAHSVRRLAARHAPTDMRTSASAHDHPLGCFRRFGVRQSPHPEPVEDSEEADNKRDEQRYLESNIPRIGIDTDDL